MNTTSNLGSVTLGRGALSADGVKNHRGPAGYLDGDGGEMLCSIRHRSYLPQVASWLSRDPVTPNIGSSYYSMADGNPATGRDPLGLKATHSGDPGAGFPPAVITSDVPESCSGNCHQFRVSCVPFLTITTEGCPPFTEDLIRGEAAKYCYKASTAATQILDFLFGVQSECPQKAVKQGAFGLNSKTCECVGTQSIIYHKDVEVHEYRRFKWTTPGFGWPSGTCTIRVNGTVHVSVGVVKGECTWETAINL
ncbi:MAG: hypothetical protein IPK67_06565 [Planctomycetes bacterium]|nr:hypothetical protein [Planctomycetota bacterium]